MNRILLAAALAATTTAAHAQPTTPPASPTPPPPPILAVPAELAVEAAQAAVAACTTNGYRTTAVVVDSSGAVRVVISGDGANPRTIDIATRKAFTAITFNRPSAETGAAIATDQMLARRIQADTRMIPWAGGQPVRSATGALLGALAVSGAPGGDKDDACVTAGLARIQARLH